MRIKEFACPRVSASPCWHLWVYGTLTKCVRPMLAAIVVSFAAAPLVAAQDCTNAQRVCDNPNDANLDEDCYCDPYVNHPFALSGNPVQASLTGSWSGPWDWRDFLEVDEATQNPEISHAALLTTGVYTGCVLLWRNAHIDFTPGP